MKCSGTPGLEQAPGAGRGNAMRAPVASPSRARPEPSCSLPELPAVLVCMVAHSGLPRHHQYIEAPVFVQLQHILAPEPEPQVYPQTSTLALEHPSVPCWSISGSTKQAGEERPFNHPSSSRTHSSNTTSPIHLHLPCTSPPACVAPLGLLC